ncbi:MAG: cation:proton antiporter [Bacilli bacterium]|jgi:NhaP-type Na+/H+ or K+/H+ antiporter|nr:cation:proton antiporter [Bacilli bacterium]
MFFLTLGIMLLGGGLLGFLFTKIRLPALLGYLLLGILMGYFGLVDAGILKYSAEIRKIALIIILLKAGLSLNLKDLKKVGRPAILMSFVPAISEMTAVGIIAHYLFGISFVESFLLGSVLGAVSPAVVVPRMTKMMKEGYGTDQGIPELITAGSSMDDIVMIVFFNSFLTVEQGGSLSAMTFLNIPISIVSGIAAGIGLGFLLALLFNNVHMRDSLKLILILGVVFLLVYLESFLAKWFSFSSLLSAITMGIVLLFKAPVSSPRIANKCDRLWTVSEIFLFVLVGASLKVAYFGTYFLPALLLIVCSLLIRSIAVQACLIKTPFNKEEKAFVCISYLPKATVQAALGGTLLDLATALGNESMQKAGIIVLSVSVVYILVTAPVSAFVMDLTYKKLTRKSFLSPVQE